MNWTTWLSRPAAIAVLLAALAGCSKSPYPLAEVHGKVTIDGAPVTAGRVMFAPIAQGESHEAGKVAIGQLQPDGTFVLTTYDEDDGAIVGDHRVVILGPTGDSAGTHGKFKFSRLAVPQKQTVVAGRQNDINIQLTARDVARFAVRKK